MWALLCPSLSVSNNEGHDTDDDQDPEPLFKGYSVASRTKNKNHLHERDPLVSELTDFEAKIIRKFGDVTEIIVRNIMKQFIIAIRLKYEGTLSYPSFL